MTTSTQQSRPLALDLNVLCSAISSETGRKYEIGDVQIPFSDLPLDPLAVMNVLEIIKERTGIELPASIFRDCTTVSEVAKRCGTVSPSS